MKKSFLVFIVNLVFLFSSIYGQTIDMKAVKAEEDLRWGIIAYNNGFYNKAVQSLEKSLALKPQNPRTLMWLGRSYYMSGMEDAALSEWDKIINTNQAPASLINLSELVRYRQILPIKPESDDEWAIHMEIENTINGSTFFERPTAVVGTSTGSGSVYVVSFSTNQVLTYNASGALKSTFDGGFEGYNHPFDIYPLKNGNFLLSEFSANQISLCNPSGNRILKIGEKGISKGQLLGPQFLASDGSNYFYVSDIGNRKIVKYDFEGNFILEMGREAVGFEGMLGPAGLSLIGNRLYAVDSINKTLEVFDENGNHLDTLVSGKLDNPEGLVEYHGELLIADGAYVRRYNIPKDRLSILSDRRGNTLRAMNLDFDDNGNLLIADYESNRITILSELSSLYGGLFLRINRVNADSFPKVVVDFSVEKRGGDPIVGLNRDNFIVTEKSRAVGNYSLEFTGYKGLNSYLTILIDGSDKMKNYRDPLTEVLKTVYEEGDRLQYKSIISSGETPYVVSDFEDNNIAEAIEEVTSRWSSRWNPDIGIRLAGSNMIPGRDRRSVLFITQGDLSEQSFERYDIIELATYYKNNNIKFNTLYTKANVQNVELEYLTKATGGESIYLFQPEGIYPLLRSSSQYISSSYTVSYESMSNPNFGRAYIPVELEAIYVKKSSRDQLGYYAPLK